MNNDQVSALLQNSFHRRSVPSDRGSISSYADGAAYKARQQSNPQIDVALYVDEADPLNPIGASRGQEKVCCLYMTVINIPPEYRAKLHCIQVVSVVSRKASRRNDQFSQFWDFVCEKLKDAECDGIWFQRFQRRLPLRFQFVAADSLGANEMLGLQMSFSQGHFCRWCLATYADIQDPCMPAKEARTISNYNQHLKDRSHGVKRPPLLRLPSVELLESFPQDVGHDIFEGVGKSVITHAFLYMLDCCTEGTVDERFHKLQNRARLFKSGPLDSGASLNFIKKGIIKGHDNINAKMDQVYKFLRFFPLLYADLFDKDDPFLEMVLWFREIVLLVMCSSLNSDAVLRLSHAIDMYCTLRKRLVKVFEADSPKKPSPNESQTQLQYNESLFWYKYHFSVKPKHHLLRHLPDMVRRFGPPKVYNTIRFEGMHRNLLERRRLANNTLNVPLTMVSRYQEESALRLHSSSFLQKFDDFEECSNDFLLEHRFVVERVLGNRTFTAACAKLCRVNPFTYRAIAGRSIPSAVLLPGQSAMECGVIVLIVVSDSVVYLLCRCRRTVKSSTFGCYLILGSPTMRLIRQDALTHPQPLHVYNVPDIGLCVVPAYFVG